MKTFDFKLVFALPKGQVNLEECLDALYEAGCDDALVGTGKKGLIGLDFARSANNVHDAIKSAKEDVLKAIPDARLKESAPDYVNATEAAAYLGITRQMINKSYKNSADFPSPVHSTGRTQLWHLFDVLEHYEKKLKSKASVSEGLLEISKETLRVNIINQASERNIHI